ncbi:hypothetical protein ACOMHN_065103 [Nucella lapillus]
MRSLKSNGGLTRGSGMGETERLVWLLSMPACAEVNISMQLVTGLSFATSKQHKDASAARQSRDHKDTQALLHFFYRRNPFLGDGKLISLAMGQEADESVNVDMAKQIGQNILDSMTGSIVSDVKFNKSNQAVTLATKTTISVQGEAKNVDPTLLFQRLVKVAQTSPEFLPSCFHYELINIPKSLFEPSGLPREAKKYELSKFLWSGSKQDNTNLPYSVHYVIDGVLFFIVWNGAGASHIASCVKPTWILSREDTATQVLSLMATAVALQPKTSHTCGGKMDARQPLTSPSMGICLSATSEKASCQIKTTSSAS